MTPLHRFLELLPRDWVILFQLHLAVEGLWLLPRGQGRAVFLRWSGARPPGRSHHTHLTPTLLTTTSSRRPSSVQ